MDVTMYQTLSNYKFTSLIKDILYVVRAVSIFISNFKYIMLQQNALSNI